jgi:hypothetical protein
MQPDIGPWDRTATVRMPKEGKPMASRLRILGCGLVLSALAMVPMFSTGTRARAQTPIEYWRIVWWNDSPHADTDYRQLDLICVGVPRFAGETIHLDRFDANSRKTSLYFVKGGCAVGYKLSEAQKAEMGLPK